MSEDGAADLEELALDGVDVERASGPVRTRSFAVVVEEILWVLGAVCELIRGDGKPTGDGGVGRKDDGTAVVIREDLKDVIRWTCVQGGHVVHYARQVLTAK